MTVTRGSSPPINEFSLGDKAAVEKMSLRAQAGLAQNYANATVALAENDEEKRKEDERNKKREIETLARIAAMNAALQSVINAAAIRMRDAQTAIEIDTAYVSKVQDGINANMQNLESQGLSVLTLSNTGLNAQALGLQQGADAVIFRDQNGYFIPGAFGVGTIRLNEQQSAQVSQFAAQTGAKDGNDDAVKTQAQQLSRDFVNRDMVGFNTETVTRENLRKASEDFQRATETQQRLANNPNDAQALREAEEIIKSNETTTTKTSEALSAPAPSGEFLKEDARAIIGAELVKNGSMDDLEREKLASDLGISVEALTALEQDLKVNDYAVVQKLEAEKLEAEKLNADEIKMTGMTVSAVEYAPTTPGAVPTLSNSVQETIAKAKAELERQAPKLEQQQLEPKTFSPTMGA